MGTSDPVVTKYLFSLVYIVMSEPNLFQKGKGIIYFMRRAISHKKLVCGRSTKLRLWVAVPRSMFFTALRSWTLIGSHAVLSSSEGGVYPSSREAATHSLQLVTGLERR